MATLFEFNFSATIARNRIFRDATLVSDEAPYTWTQSIDDASNLKGSGGRVVFNRPEYLLIEKSLMFIFKDSKNHDEYEALVADMVLALEMCVSNLKAKSECKMVEN